jgi:hypothetical protein
MVEMKKNNARVFIEPGAVYCSAGNTLDALWQVLINTQQNMTKLPCPAYEGWPWTEVFLVDEPGATELGVDRKILRTMEKQAKLALYGATLAVQQVECIATKLIRSEQKGLYLALPTVDESVPPWSLLETLHEVSANPLQPEELSSSEFLQREIPAFFGLSTLNSNACAHISASFDLTGAMAAYSPFADAAFQALIDAAGSITQGENTVALVGGVSPKVNPQLLLQYEFWGWDKSPARIPAEASSFVVVRANDFYVNKQLAMNKPASAYVSGFARGFIGGSTDKSKIYQQVFMKALAKANIVAADIDWFLPYATHNEDTRVLLGLGAKESLPVLISETSIGFAGAAGPMINLNLALFGLQQQKYLHNVNCSINVSAGDITRVQEKAGFMRHVALSVAGPEGQYAVVILSLEVV